MPWRAPIARRSACPRTPIIQEENMRHHSVLTSLLVVCATTGTALAEDCNPTDTRLLKPELVALQPLRARVVQRRGARRLYFTTSIANVGNGPLVIEAHTVDTPDGPVTHATQVV